MPIVVNNLPRPMLWLVIVLIMAGIGWSDVVTGEELGYSIFYMLPVFMAVWYLGRNSGILVSFLCGLGTLGVYHLEHPLERLAFVPVWNSIVHLGVFILMCLILSALRRALKRERGLARIDPLTQVVNLRGFGERINLEIDRARRSGRPLTLAYLDLDNFKAINDHHGHTTGDRLLSQIGEILRKGVRTTDLVARLGGDEFAILFPETTLEQGRAIVGKLREQLRAAMCNNAWPVTFSFGLDSFDRDSSSFSLDEMIRRVDALMYQAKQQGKDRVCEESLPDARALEKT
jgi:diguanylate cyclase (GGDEF)-like protein